MCVQQFIIVFTTKKKTLVSAGLLLMNLIGVTSE